MILLDSEVATFLQGITDKLLNGTDTSLQTSFQGVYQAVIKFSNGVVAVGMFVTGVYLILQYLISSQFDYASLLKMLVMLTMYLGFSAVISPKGGSSIMAVTSNIMDNFTATINTGQDDIKLAAEIHKGQEDAKADEDANGGSSILAAASTLLSSLNIGKIIMDCLYNFLDSLVDICMVAIGFLIVFISKFGCWLLIAFAPFCVAISFIKGFEGSFVGMLKYFIVFKLWAVIFAAIKLAMHNMDFVNQLAYAAGYQSVSNSPSLSTIVMKLCCCIVLIMTPQFADILVSGSQAGGFFSAAIAKGGAVMGGAASSMSGNIPGNVGRNMDHLGGAGGALKKAASVLGSQGEGGGFKGLISGIKRLGLNPNKNDGLKH